MGDARQQSLSDVEPVSLAEAKLMVRQTATTTDDGYIGALITAAREQCELVTNRCLARRDWVLPLDAFPYYSESMVSLPAASSPRSATTLWNYSQMIKLPWPPLVSVTQIRYIATDKSVKILTPGTGFVVDRINEPGRVFPLPGATWPAALYVPDAVEVLFTAGYAPDPEEGAESSIPFNPVGTNPGQQPDSIVALAIPQSARAAILQLVTHWYRNREPVAAGTVSEVPWHVSQLLAGLKVFDFSPTVA